MSAVRHWQMRLVVFLGALLLLASLAPAAMANIAAPGGAWYWQNATPQGNDVYGMCFFDLNTGWAVGDAGTILATVDGGATCKPQVLPVSLALTGVTFTDVTFYDATTGWAVSDSGKIIATVNGGTTWTEQTSGVATGLNRVFALDQDKVYVVGDGGVILYTADGGATAWVKLATPTLADLNSIFFKTPNNGWIVGDGGRVLRTNNGGVSWFFGTSGTGTNLNDVVFASLYEGWAVGNGDEIRHTVNGGATWADQSVGGGDDFQRIVLASSGAWIAGTGGRVASSTDGGENWDNAASGTNRDLYGLSVNGSDVRVAGTGGFFSRAVDGATFMPLWMAVTAQQLNDAAFIDAANGWAVGAAGTILRTADKGTNWFRQESGVATQLNDVATQSATNAWVVGNRSGGAGTLGTMLVTTDGGLTWQQKITADGIPNLSLNSVDFVSLTTGWAVGAGQSIIVTGTGGGSWTAQTSGAPGGALTGVDATTATNASVTYANGGSGGVRYTINGGANWLGGTVPGGTPNLNGVDMIETTPTVGYTVGDGGTILKTVDAGVNWTGQTSNTTENLYDVSFAADGLNGIAVGDAGTVVATADGGTTWTVAPWAFSNGLRGAAAYTDPVSTATSRWICGTGGAILSNFNPNTLAVTGLKADAGDTKITVSWTNPTTDFGGVMVYYSTSRCASSVYDTYTQEVAFEGTGQTLTRTGLENYKLYYFTVFVRNTAGTWSDGQTLVVAPIPTFKVTLAVKPATQTSGKTIKFSGKVTPGGPASGKKINIQRFTGSWKTFATATVKGDGSYAVSKSLSRGTYRVRAYMPGVSGKALTGYSASRYVTWK